MGLKESDDKLCCGSFDEVLGSACASGGILGLNDDRNLQMFLLFFFLLHNGPFYYIVTNVYSVGK